MKNKISKTEAKKEIDEFFSDIKNKSPKEIKKIKRLAMRYNIPLKEKKKLFCRKCFNAFSGEEKIRIKNKMKSVSCKKCDCVSRWGVKN